ncbi:MAG: hypothetical protein AAB461_03210 [Patescibacteria group bacterium]
MSLKQNKNKTAEEKREETGWAAEQLGFALEPLFEDDDIIRNAIPQS